MKHLKQIKMKLNIVALTVFLLFSLQARCDSNNEDNKSISNSRILLTIPYSDRENLLHVMRNNLENLGKMIDAMSSDDFEAVQKIADSMSFNKKKGKGLARRGNNAFTAMGVQFHAEDTIAVMKAAKDKDRKETLIAMSKMVNTCVACHSTFRVMEWPDDKEYERPESTELILPEGYKITH